MDKIKYVIQPHRNGRFYPIYRVVGQPFQYHFLLLLGVPVSFETEEEAQRFIDKKPVENGWRDEETQGIVRVPDEKGILEAQALINQQLDQPLAMSDTQARTILIQLMATLHLEVEVS